MVSKTQHAKDSMECAKVGAKQTDNQEFLRRLILLLRHNIEPHLILNYSIYPDPFQS
jgi:hypothetical protein